MPRLRAWAAELSLLALLLTALPGCAATPHEGTTAAEAEPVPGEELAKRGAELAAQGDDFGAEQYLESAIKAGYPEGPATRLMVSSCIGGGRLERARTHAQRYVERHPDDWIFHHVLASIYFAEGQGLLAREILTLLISEHPEHAPSNFLLGLVLRDQVGDMDGARHAFERYLALAPGGAHQEEARAWLRRSRAFPAVAASVEARPRPREQQKAKRR